MIKHAPAGAILGGAAWKQLDRGVSYSPTTIRKNKETGQRGSRDDNRGENAQTGVRFSLADLLKHKALMGKRYYTFIIPFRLPYLLSPPWLADARLRNSTPPTRNLPHVHIAHASSDPSNSPTAHHHQRNKR
jgi:hypothetical protein